MTVYLGNGTRYAHGYNGTLIGSQVADLYVSVPMTFSDSNPGFKVTVYLQVKYLKNGSSYGQSYYSTLIGNHT